MLVTTCPECDTTFRVTPGILDQAAGQVRCGRCAHVFDANTALREHPDTETRPIGAAESPAAESSGAESSGAETEAAVPAAPATEEDSGSAWFLTDAPHTGELEQTDDIEQSDDIGQTDAGRPADAGGPAVDGPTADDEAEDSELAAETAAAKPSAAAADSARSPEDQTPDWLPPLAPAGRRRRWPYVVAASLLVIALALQVVHRFRDELAAVPMLAGPLQSLYAGLGFEPPMNVDLERYELLDLTAVAEPVSEEQGWLVIETRVQNTGPRAQPVPHIFVALLDRWQETIAGRYFSPEEYALNAGNYSRLASGGTIDAQFIIVDPGPAATGFELQICAPRGSGFICDGDALFE